MTTKEYPEPIIKSCGLSIRFNTIFLPFNVFELSNALNDHAFQISPEFPRAQQFSKTVTGAGIIATKGFIPVDFNTERQMIGVTSKTIKNSSTIFNELLTVLGKIDVNLKDTVKLYEAIVDFQIITPNSSIEFLSATLEKSEFIQKIQSITGLNTRIGYLRINSDVKSIETEDYWNYSLSPTVFHSGKLLEAQFVGRSKTKIKMIHLAENCLQNLKEIIKVATP